MFRFSKALNFLDFKVIIASNDKNLFSLIVSQLPFGKTPLGPGRRRKHFNTVYLRFIKCRYRALPRSANDCFQNFTLFYNRFYEGNVINYDIGPRTLRTTIDSENGVITSHIATPPDFEKDVLFDLTFFQPLKCLLQFHGRYFLHASCAAQKNSGILFCGQTGQGKTTLALSMHRAGYEFFSDDKVVLSVSKGRVWAHGFLSRPKLTKKSLKLFPELRAGSGARGKGSRSGKTILGLKARVNSSATRGVFPGLLIFPEYKKTSAPCLKPISRQQALALLLDEEFLKIKFADRRLSEKQFFLLALLLRQARVFRLYYRDEDLHQIPGLLRKHI